MAATGITQICHPLAHAITQAARQQGINLVEAEEFIAVTGKGVTGYVNGRRVILGNHLLLAEMNIEPGRLSQRSDELRRDGQTVMFVGVDDQPLGLLGVADPIKASTFEALEMLKKEGVDIIMVTGDSAITAQAIGRQLNLSKIEAEVLPQQKNAIVRRLQSEGRTVAMAGDGINDAPALAQAQVGIAMGTGTDIAMESAGVTLIKGDLRGIVKARRLSRATMRNIRQNLFFSFGYNALGIPIAAGVLYPVFGILLNPMISAAAMSLSSLFVISNALRLRQTKL